MEGVGYSVGASIFPAVAVGADHARQRIYFVCDADGNGESGCEVNAEAPGMSWDRGNAAEVVRAHGAAPRMAVMRSIGNAIVPQQAQAFIEAYMECRP
jgi:hypothetical protein